MNLQIFLILGTTVIGQFRLTQGTSYVRPISEQWPWAQWTTTLAPGQVPSTYPPPSTSRPPPEVTFLPPTEEEKRLLIITDPTTGQVLYIPAHVFWERFGGGGRVTSTTTPRPFSQGMQNTPRNPFVCDFYARNCWLPTQQPVVTETAPAVPSRGGGGGSHIYGHPNFHQGAFPGPNEPPRESGRTQPGSSESTTTTRRPFRPLPASTARPDIETDPDLDTRRPLRPSTFPTTTRRPVVNIPEDTDPGLDYEQEPWREPTTTNRPRPTTTTPRVQGIPSRGGGGGAHIYGHPNFHQGAFPDPKEPPRSAGRTTRETPNSFSLPSFGITSQSSQFFRSVPNLDTSGSSAFGVTKGQESQNFQPFPVQPPAEVPIFQNYDPNTNVFLYTSTREETAVQQPQPPRQRFSGGTGIGGVNCPKGSADCLQKSRVSESKPQYTAPPSLRRVFSSTAATTTLEPKIRVTRPASTLAPSDTTTTTTTEASLDYKSA